MITILYKNGDKKNLYKYRPISLLPHVLKLHIKIIKNKIDLNLRKNKTTNTRYLWWTLNNGPSLRNNSGLEKINECNVPLYMSFRDYKAFESINHEAVFSELGK